jgi:hypothetical protein
MTDFDCRMDRCTGTDICHGCCLLEKFAALVISSNVRRCSQFCQPER